MPSNAARLGLVVASLCAATAGANTFQTLGQGPRATAMGGAQTADAFGAPAVFYNPAMLVLPREFSFDLAISALRAVAQVQATDPSKELHCAACRPGTNGGLSASFLFPLKGKIENRAAIGVSLYMPMRPLVGVRQSDPQRPSWYLYDNHPDRMVILLGAGFRITEDLTLGLGMEMLADLGGNGVDLRIDLFSREVTFREIDQRLEARGAPTAGLYLAPQEGVRLGLSFRGEMYLAYSVPAKVNMEGVGNLDFVVSGKTQYTPHALTLGVAVDATPALTLTADLSYRLWSRAPTPYVQLDVDLSGETLRALGLDEALDLVSEAVPPGFIDTVNLSIGVEGRPAEGLALRGGAYLRPTPVPQQNAFRTNILDATAIGVSAGMGVSFRDPLELFEKPVTFDLAGQGAMLLPREARKDESDQVPSYRYQALVFGGMIGLRYAM